MYTIPIHFIPTNGHDRTSCKCIEYMHIPLHFDTEITCTEQLIINYHFILTVCILYREALESRKRQSSGTEYIPPPRRSPRK